ncbi:S1 family peptidase [Pseudarthrobacter sp. NPDC058329]|uniref:S1 family peptidase n=1 Tax=Pseudarthrobacter sp. NPDC058329 TaxID=3346448 RepID=UPI0036D76BA8
MAEASDSGLSEDALQEAVLRDLGMTAEEFAAAGELGTAAAEVAKRLQNVPGYAGIRLQDGHILVSGSGAELLAEVAVLSSSTPVLAVEDPAQVRQGKAAGQGAKLQPRGTELAVSTEELFQAYIREVGADGLQAVVSSGGKFVIRTGGVNLPESTAGPTAGSTASAGTADATAEAVASGKKSAAEFVSRYANVELDGGTPLTPEADVPGGVGFIADTGWVCSTGFSAFDPSGLPAVLTAGHCASDGAATTADLTFQGVSVGLLGSFGFSQFGGPGNSWIAENPLDPDNPGNVGTDVAVINDIRADLDPLAAASTFGDPEQPGPDVKIIGTADPVEGMDVCRSGKTSGWSCGTVDEVGIYTVPGSTYVEPSDTTDPAEPLDLRAFRGFLSYDVQSSGGDSGGPYVSGNYAVGTHAAGEPQPKPGELPPPNQAIGATLTGSLAVLPGYQLELFLNKPVVSTPAPGATYEPGQAIGGTVPAAPASAVAAGSAVRIAVEGQEPFEVPVNADGGWSFPASGAEGTLRFTAETVNGFSTSGTSSFEFAPAVQEPPVPAAPQEPAAADPAPAAPPAPADSPPAVVVIPADTAPPAGLANTSGTGYDRTHRGALANTGASALGQAAAAAGAAIVVGGVLMVLARRRRQRTHK